MIRPTDQETIPIEKVVYTIPKRRKYTMLEGAPRGSSGVGYKAEGDGGSLGEKSYCDFCGKNGQGRVSRLSIG